MRLNHVTLSVSDLARAVSFYETLGLSVIVRNATYARLLPAEGDTTLSLTVADHPATDVGRGAHIYFECDDLDARVGELELQGIVFDSGPEDRPYRWREAWLRDPDGSSLCLYYAGEVRRTPSG